MKLATSAIVSLVMIAACTIGPVASGPTASAGRTTASHIPVTPWPVSISSAPCTPALPRGSAPLMVVLERRNTSGPSPDTVVIAGLDAIGRARASFQPRTSLAARHDDANGKPTWDEPHLYVGSIGTNVLSPHQAYVIRASVYFVDGYGTVFRLGLNGKQTVVTKFPIGLDQQEVSFAVSPDGCQLAATVLTLPPAPPLTDASVPPLTGTWTLQTMSATAGEAAKVLHTWTSTEYPNTRSASAFENLVLAGWDFMGPIAVVGSSLVCTQANSYQCVNAGPIANADFYGGRIAHLTAGGTAAPAVPLQGCSPVQVSPHGEITCYTLPAQGKIRLSVLRSTDGTQLTSAEFAVLPEGPYDRYPNVAVSAGGQIAFAGQQPAGGSPEWGYWLAPDGSNGGVPAGFHPQGWMDESTVFGRVDANDHAGLVRARDPALRIEDLEFQGDFVGMLSSV